MVDARRKKERRRELPKPTSKLPPLAVPTDRAVAAKQRAFCKNIVNQILDDDSSLSFSQPVQELWDMSALTDYFEKIKEPMDLGTIKKALANQNGFLNSETQTFDPNAFRRDVRLVFLNAMDFNSKGTDLYRLANRFLSFIDKELLDLPGQPVPQDEGHTGPDQAPESQQKPDSRDKDRIDHDPAKDPEDKKGPSEPAEEKSDKADDEPENNDDVDDMKDENPPDNPKEDGSDEESEKLNRQITALENKRKEAEAALAELEIMRNVPLTYEENTRLRDEVERLPWETAKKVVKILQKYVDEAVSNVMEDDPEFVTLEFSTVEPRLLRDIEELIRPNPKVEKEKKTIANLDEEINALRRKLKRKSDRDHGVKKKPRRRR